MICLVVISIFLFNPTPTNAVYPALFLSYPLLRSKTTTADAPILYGKSKKDFVFVGFYTVFLSCIRAFLMQRVMRSIAIRSGITSRARQSRFMEQMYTAIYFAIFGPCGLYLMSQTPMWYFNTSAMYAEFPHRTHEAMFKAYYLLQASYWTQQMLVILLMLEKPRKDFRELVLHHLITLSLIGLSYRFHFTYMGLAVYITHDISEFFIAVCRTILSCFEFTDNRVQTSKVLNYLNSSIVIPFFLVFLMAWTYLRHYINLQILASMLPLPSPFSDQITAQIRFNLSSITSGKIASINPAVSTLGPLALQFHKIFPQVCNLIVVRYKALTGPWQPSQFSTIGPYTLDWEAEQYKGWISQWIAFTLLAALQAVNIFWTFLIFRIFARLIRTFGAERVDERSECDSDEEGDRRAEFRVNKAN
jgi:acyl-CoA-dependent ceramide synthase